MKHYSLFGSLCRILCVSCCFLVGMNMVIAQNPAEEEIGTDEGSPTNPPVRDPAAHARALNLLGIDGLLLIPESSNDRVMAFDPNTGDLVDPDFIPSDTTNLSTPINAILGIDPNTILVSDQLEDVVLSYDMDGNFLGVFAPSGGPNTSILDNIRGIAISPDNTLLVTVGSGTNADAIAEFDGAGNYLGNLVANGAGGLDSPFDVLLRGNDYLVGGITSDAIYRYGLDGTFLDIFSPINGFPEQVAEAGNGNVLTGNFSGTEEGVVEYTSTGTLVGIYDPSSLGGYRGAYELPNGNILTTNGSGVHEIDRSGNLVETKISGVSARFIENLAPAIVCENIQVQVGIGEPVIVVGNPGCLFDLYNTQCSDDPNDWILLAEDIEIPDSGIITVPSIVGQPDSCYVVTPADSVEPLNAPVKTVPTLGRFALIVFVLLLLMAGMLTMRRKRKA